MGEDNYYDDRLNYQESCFIVNAMSYYLAAFKSKTDMSEEALKYYKKIIEKYTKLENQIMDLRIKEGN